MVPFKLTFTAALFAFLLNPNVYAQTSSDVRIEGETVAVIAVEAMNGERFDVEMELPSSGDLVYHELPMVNVIDARLYVENENKDVTCFFWQRSRGEMQHAR